MAMVKQYTQICGRSVFRISTAISDRDLAGFVNEEAKHFRAVLNTVKFVWQIKCKENASSAVACKWVKKGLKCDGKGPNVIKHK